MAEEAPLAIDSTTLGEALRRTAAGHPNLVAVRTLDGETSITWSQLREQVNALAGSLAALGLGRGDSIALMMGNRPEFHVADLAAVTLGAIPFSVYKTFEPEQLRHVLVDASPRVAIVEQAQLQATLALRDELPALAHVIVLEGPAPAGTLSLSELPVAPVGFDVNAALAAVRPDDVATLIYTSGTTGPPKGVELTHANVAAAMRGSLQFAEIPPGSGLVSWLPAAHISERAAHHYLAVFAGCTITTLSEPERIVEALTQVRPAWFFAVPRVWEGFKAGVEAMLVAQPDDQRARSEAALTASLEAVRLRQRGATVPEELALAVERADAELFADLRAKLGLDQAVVVNSGAAPIAPEVIEFFHALGIELSEVWGMSETCGVATINYPGVTRIGTVGQTMPGIEVKLAHDGELLVRGDKVTRGYRNHPEQTAATIDSEGWLATGDLARIDPDGYVTIVDRKKEIIINSAGKNMSPANIEGALKATGPLIGEACVIGDRRPYNVALIALDPEAAPTWAGQRGIEDCGLATLVEDPHVRAAVQEGIDAANTKLAPAERVKRFAIVPDYWQPGGDYLTPTMKLRRRPIAEKYIDAISELYM